MRTPFNGGSPYPVSSAYLYLSGIMRSAGLSGKQGPLARFQEYGFGNFLHRRPEKEGFCVRYDVSGRYEILWQSKSGFRAPLKAGLMIWRWALLLKE